MRSILYLLARIVVDVNVLRRGRIGARVGRRIVGRGIMRALGRLLRP